MSAPSQPTKPSTKEVRQIAEVRAQEERDSKQTILSESEAQKTLHELQVHQIELVMQNEELQQARITERLHYRYTELFEFAPIAYFAFEASGIISQVNLRGASLLGIERASLAGEQFSNYVIAEHCEIFKDCLSKVFVGQGIQSCEILVIVNKTQRWLNIEANLGITGTDCLAALIDITDRKKSEYSQKIAGEEKEKRADELALANIELAFQNKEKDNRADELILANEEKEKRADELALANIELAFQNKEKEKRADELALAAKVFSHAREGIVITDAQGNIIEVNDTFSLTTGYSREESIGQKTRIVNFGRQSREFYVEMLNALIKEGYWSGEVWSRRKNGEMYAEIKTISAVHDEHGTTTHYVALGNDITPMKEHQTQLEYIAHYDILTNLPNRVLLADRLSQAMLKCSRQEHSLAVVFLDLDGFKAVNDIYGHNIGDELLIAVSIRMSAALREGDTLARIGGDEFVAVLADLVTVDDCQPVVDRLLLAASESVTVGDVVLNISASIGVTLYPQDNSDTDLLMRHADQAMYRAKELGKNCYHVFDTTIDDAVKVRQESLDAIRCALDNHEFVLHYQPKVNMKTGVVVGVEALIRWQHPTRGLLSPIEFLPVIESNPMMIEMGEWVIDTALAQIIQWQKTELNSLLTISVNIAAVQLQQPDFTHRLTALLAVHFSVEPRYLELEVLETSALDDVNHVSTIMNACKELGVNFALDDFGTGYSSLTYLRRLPASLIKIDQSFVRDMLVDSDDLAIVTGIIALAKSFDRDVIAEGVETIEHGKALLELGCHLAQGYGIARPMPANEILAWISNWKPHASWQT
ncbi:MAG: diguanylate cyclase (GGDEF)-like protein/PAS domain S-box-containing protein [Oleispira sp.]|jgi:diguanylate cyclase (GGDEF)-like protein/PAS domain S-box-containing protein